MHGGILNENLQNPKHFGGRVVAWFGLLFPSKRFVRHESLT